jgi:hypothetical protein
MKTLLSLFCLCLCVSSAFAQPVFAPFAQNEVNAHHYADLDDAVAAIGANPATLVLYRLTTLTQNTTVPAHVEVAFKGDGRIDCNGWTIRLEHDLQAPRQRLFQNCLPTRVQLAANTVIYPEWFGAFPDDATDDVPEILVAVESFEGDTGGALLFGKGVYDFSSATVPGTFTFREWCVRVRKNNVTIQGQGAGSILRRNVNCSVFFPNGAMRGVSDPDVDWWANRYVDPSETLYDMANASRGDASVTLTTASEANNFAVGDWVYLRAGELNITSDTTPDAEINQVISADGGTGVIALRWPLAKNYSDTEVFPTGHPNQGNPTPFGIANVDNQTLENFTLRDVSIDAADGISPDYNADQHLVLWQVVGVRIENVTGRLVGSGIGGTHWRSGHIVNNDLKMDVHPDEGSRPHWWFSTASGSTDVTIAHNHLSGGTGYLHIHEGSAGIAIIGNQIESRGEAEQDKVIPLIKRARDIRIIGNTITNWGNDEAILLDSSAVEGGIILGNSFLGSGGADPLQIQTASKNWLIKDNIFPAANQMAVGATAFEVQNTFFDPPPEIYLTPRDFGIKTGTPTLGTIGATFPAEGWILDSGVLSELSTVFPVPQRWRNVFCTAYWTNLSTNSGNVSWRFQTGGAIVGESIDAQDSSRGVVIAAPAQYVLEIVKNTNGNLTVEPTGLLTLVIGRQTASDTLSGQVGFLGAVLRPQYLAGTLQ